MNKDLNININNDNGFVNITCFDGHVTWSPYSQLKDHGKAFWGTMFDTYNPTRY